MNLHSLQRQFKKFIVGPGNSDAQTLRHIHSDMQGSPKSRMQVYQTAYRIRLVESLAEDFPNVVEAAGEDYFERLAIRYLERYPSTYWTVAEVGKHFARYLNQNAKLKCFARAARKDWLDAISRTQDDSAPSAVHPVAELSTANLDSVALVIHPSILADEYRSRSQTQRNLLQALARDAARGRPLAKTLRDFAHVHPKRANRWFIEWVESYIIVGFVLLEER